MQQVILLKWGTPKENYKDYYDFLQKCEINPYEEKTLKWSDTLQEDLWENFEVLKIRRPNPDFADYKARKIIFEKYIPYFKDDFIFVWHSLGWTFFLKYFEENPWLLKKLKKAILVAPAIKDSPNELLWSFTPNLNFLNLKKYENKIVVFASKDDFIVPFEEIEILQKILKVKYQIFEDKGHFLQEKFNELYKEIKWLT